MSEHVVVAFGGNAIMPRGREGTLAEQWETVGRMAAQLGELVLAGHQVVVTHGNGPQVGEIMLRSDLAREQVPALTLDVAGAMSQGQIGYMLQQSIGNFLAAHGASTTVCPVVTRCVVDPRDPAFQRPTKPIGRFYDAEEAERLRQEKGWNMVEDAGRGWRRVVPSPVPQTIAEWPAVRALLEEDVLVIAAGGGGVPVVNDGGQLRGVEAVIDKDLAAQRLASLVGARVLVLLTEVDAVAVHFGTPEQRPLGVIERDELERYYEEGQFPPGSMGPKVRAALDFIAAGGERAIITSTDLLADAVNDIKAGTQVVPSRVGAATGAAETVSTGAQ